jgi:hypothetical protein
LDLSFLDFSSVAYQLLSSLLLQPGNHFIHLFHSQTEVQSLVVLAQAMLRHMDRHSDARGVLPLRVLPLQLTQSNCTNGLSFLPRLVKHWLLETALERPMIDAEHGRGLILRATKLR